MKKIASIIGSHPAARLAAAGCLAASLAGCADSERLADPFSNPFHTAANTADRTPTGSVGDSYNAVQSAPLAPPPGQIHATPSAPLPSAPLAYAPAHSTAPFVGSTAASYPPSASANRSSSPDAVAGWTAEGGMPIVVAQGESLGLVARRYGIPEAALLRTNGFASAAQVRPGTRLIIPVYSAALATASGVRPGARQEMAEHAAHQKLAKAEADRQKDTRVDPKTEAKAKHEEKLAKHEEKLAEAVPVPKVEKVPDAKIEKVALTDTGAAAEPKKPIDTLPALQDHAEDKTAAGAAAPEFRWPARGRIIRNFPGNDGINIALPENTPVKAAEAGVVAYAGNEIKGYGNLVLIRHPNGFVSAYANNSEIDVKRGDTVKRGQVIAKSGQTGNVSTPQLHFELRKGAKPVDPIQYLAGL